MSFHRQSVRQEQKLRRRAKLKQRDHHRDPLVTVGRPLDPTRAAKGYVEKRPYVRRTVRAENHPRRDPGYRRHKRVQAVLDQERLDNQRADNRTRLAILRMEGKPLPGQKPNPATVRK